MANITVTPQKLREAAQELRGLNSDFKAQVDNLSNQESTLNSQWEGQAHDNFHAAFNNDKNSMDLFAQTIEQYCQALEQIAQQYDTAETKNANTAATRTY